MTDFGRRPPVAAPNRLPKTGQTISYRDGDDGYHESGWEDGDRFTDNGDGTITDKATNLMWPKDWGGDGGNSGNKLNWNSAIDWAVALEFAGYSDWRLPNSIEMISMFNSGAYGPSAYPVFTIPSSEAFWTSSTVHSYETYGYWTYTDYSYLDTTAKTWTERVVAVRNA